ncbi:MAG TPA: FHA domain-containing protein [Gemmatimonadaceae bacterium]|nr:FHA domain-containing protein [Gemmatimonadaceae bacterium]
MPWLTTEGASHQLAEGETTVGSGEQADWRVESAELAARHFVIEAKGDQATVRPCGMDDVIAVNGTQAGAAPRELHDGDTIDAGTARFLFSKEQSGTFPAVAIEPAYLVESRDGVTYPLELQAVGIGRDRLNAVVVRDPTASRFHAEIRREAGGYVLHPFGSSGTLVNARRVGAPARLENGDRIEIANVELRFHLGPVPEGARMPEPAPNDESSQRRTVIGAAAMEIPPEEKGRSGVWLWVAAAVVIAVTVYLATR